MSRVRRTISLRRARADCKLGHHRFGPGTEAGGGIIRRNCRHCGVLSIDLTGVETSRMPVFHQDRKSGIPERAAQASN